MLNKNIHIKQSELNFHPHGACCLHGLYISVGRGYEKGQSAWLSCNVKARPVRIVWWYDLDRSGQKVTRWTHGSGPPSGHGQWQGRTELNTDTGDIIIHDLMIADVGNYTCRYYLFFQSNPGVLGDTHTVNISKQLLYL